MGKRIDATRERIWFTGDTHFHHIGILGHTNRPFADVGEMNAAMIKNWNDRVGPDDTIFHLGDFLLYRNKLKDWSDLVSQLNGKIILIRGNHDHANAPNTKVWDLFHECHDYLDLSIREVEGGGYTRRVVLCHYPITTWNGRWQGSFMLHGHSHGGIPTEAVHCGACNEVVFPNCRRVDVGVDCWGYAPVAYETLRDYMLTIPFGQDKTTA